MSSGRVQEPAGGGWGSVWTGRGRREGEESRGLLGSQSAGHSFQAGSGLALGILTSGRPGRSHQQVDGHSSDPGNYPQGAEGPSVPAASITAFAGDPAWAAQGDLAGEHGGVLAPVREE